MRFRRIVSLVKTKMEDQKVLKQKVELHKCAYSKCENQTPKKACCEAHRLRAWKEKNFIVTKRVDGKVVNFRVSKEEYITSKTSN